MSLPLLLTLTDRLCVVVGGGTVGQRKASMIVAAGGRVRLVCLEARPASLDDVRVEWLTEAYEARHLAGASLVFAAATAEVNDRVTADARAAGLWVNRADHPEAGDFLLPAVLRRGELTIAIGTGGASPLLAQRVRDQLAPQFDEAFADWTALLAEFRHEILERVSGPARRRECFARLCDEHWLTRLRRDGRDATAAAMRAELDAELSRGL